MYDVEQIRRDFPILAQLTPSGKPVTFLDSAASSQKPRAVIQAMVDCMEQYYANIHRGVYAWSERSSVEYGAAKHKIAALIGARPTDREPEEGHPEIVFTRNATESINLVAQTWGRRHIGPGDEILTTVMEHHANIVPWQQLAQERGATVRYVDIDEQGRLRLDQLGDLLTPRTKLVAVTAMSNVLGTVNPVRKIAAMAHAVGAVILVDGAQSVPHRPVDVQDLDCDFLVFSGHKMLAPPGSGVLYGKAEILETMPPFLFGGDMIRTVTLDGATWNDLPWKFEAGTPAIVDAIGLGAAADYLMGLGMANVAEHERELTAYAMEQLGQVPSLRIYGPPAAERGGAVAFTLDGIHPHDIGTLLDAEGICVRTGLHCAQPLHTRLGLPATARASFYVYTLREEIDRLVAGLDAVRRRFARPVLAAAR